jgi:hypothetical protein
MARAKATGAEWARRVASRSICITVAPVVLYAWVIGNPAYGRPDHDVALIVVAIGVVATALLPVGMRLLSQRSPASNVNRWSIAELVLLAPSFPRW